MTTERSIDDEIEAWRQEAFAAKRREIAMFALGASTGLRWAKERFLSRDSGKPATAE